MYLRPSWAQECDCNTTVVGPIPTGGNELLFINIFISPLWHQAVEAHRRVPPLNILQYLHFYIYKVKNTLPWQRQRVLLYYALIDSLVIVNLMKPEGSLIERKKREKRKQKAGSYNHLGFINLTRTVPFTSEAIVSFGKDGRGSPNVLLIIGNEG